MLRARGRDEVRADHGLADARRRDEHADVVGEQRLDGLLLERRQLAVEGEVERRSALALVLDVER